MKKIKVSKISLKHFDLLRAAGYQVEIEQMTIKPANPRLKYDQADAISVLTKQRKRGLDPVVKPSKLDALDEMLKELHNVED